MRTLSMTEFTKLPEEILHTICAFFKPHTLAKLATTDKRLAASARMIKEQQMASIHNLENNFKIPKHVCLELVKKLNKYPQQLEKKLLMSIVPELEKEITIIFKTNTLGYLL